MCQDHYKSALFLSIALFGCTVGGLLGGMINDTFGRIRSMQVSSLAMILSVVASGLAGYFQIELIFLLGQFIMMFASEIAFGAFISYTMEVLGPAGRSWVGVLANVTANGGMIVVTFFAWFLKDWKLNMYASAAVMLIGLLMQLLCPESPRWIHQKLPRDKSKPKVIAFIKSIKSDVDSLTIYNKIEHTEVTNKKATWISPGN